MYFLLAIWLWLPVVFPFAWIPALLFLFREKDSVFLRLHAAQMVLCLLLFGLAVTGIRLAGDAVQYTAAASQSMTAVFEAALTRKKLDGAVTILRLAMLLPLAAEAILAYTYRLYEAPGLGRLAERLEKKTRPGPLR